MYLTLDTRIGYVEHVYTGMRLAEYGKKLEYFAIAPGMYAYHLQMKFFD